MGRQRGNYRQAKRKERKETVKNTCQNELNTIKLRMPPPKSQYGYGPFLNSEGMGMFPCGELASFTLLLLWGLHCTVSLNKAPAHRLHM